MRSHQTTNKKYKSVTNKLKNKTKPHFRSNKLKQKTKKQN